MIAACERSKYDGLWCAIHDADFWSGQMRCEQVHDLQAARTFAREASLVVARRPDAKATRTAWADEFSRDLLSTAERTERCGCCGRNETLEQRLQCEREAFGAERDDERRSRDQ